MSYPGGKSGSGVYQTLINLMPPHDIYIEPFLGMGGVFISAIPRVQAIPFPLTENPPSEMPVLDSEVCVPAREVATCNTLLPASSSVPRCSTDKDLRKRREEV
jgi:hypothetical protein